MKNNKKNVLVVANWKSDVGYAWWLMENFWVQISVLADENNVECHLIYPELNELPEAISSASIKTTELNYNDVSIKGHIALLLFVIKNRINFIYLTDKRYFSLRYVLLKLVGVSKIIVHDHTPGQRDIPKGLKKQLKRIMNALPVMTADAVVAVTPYVKNRHIFTNCIASEKIHVAKNGIVPIGRSAEYSDYAHKEFGIPADAVIIFTSGRADSYKRIDFVIECANVLINKEQQNVFFVYCGGGSDIDEFKALCSRYELNHKFIFAGVRKDVRQIAQSCDIGIQASKGEVGYSLSILEYMSAGLATLVPDNPSVCASVSHGKNGLVYQEGSIESACTALISVIQDEGMRDKLSINAQKTVESQYNLNETNRDFKSIMNKIYFN